MGIDRPLPDPLARARRAALALCSALALSLASSPALAEGDEAPRHFYFGRDYGSEAVYNPLFVVLNRGYDVLQVRVGSRDVFRIDYRDDGANVAENLFVHPVRSVREEGVGKFLREEIFPLSYTSKTARWVPNYTLHLVGGGETYAALDEWFQAHEVPLPRAFSAATLLSVAMLNETLENKGSTGRNTDAIADFYFFDIGGIIAFSFEPVRRFFSESLIIADWSPQPGFTYPGLELHNHGQYFSAKLPLPAYPKLRLFSYFGMSTMFGASYLGPGGYSLSLAAGQRATRLVGEQGLGVHNDVQFTQTAGVFVDKNNSLLASLQVSNVRDYFVNINLYPGAVPALGELGAWAVIDRSGRPIVGLSTRLGVGLGLGH